MYSVRMVRWLGLSALVVALDQSTKWLALEHLTYAEPVEVLPGLDWTLLFNRGMAFSLLSDGGWQVWLLTGFTALISAVLLVWLFRTPAAARWQAASLSLIIGGALGNLIDRVRYGHVVDFIDVHYAAWHWPAFNVADSAITVGAVMLAIVLFLEDRAEGGVGS